MEEAPPIGVFPSIEYKFVPIETRSDAVVEQVALEQLLNEQAQAGWELAGTYLLDQPESPDTTQLMCIFKQRSQTMREMVQEEVTHLFRRAADRGEREQAGSRDSM